MFKFSLETERGHTALGGEAGDECGDDGDDDVPDPADGAFCVFFHSSLARARRVVVFLHARSA